MSARRRQIVLWASSVALLCALLEARMLLGARSELARARIAIRAGQQSTADRHLRRTLAYYAPFNPWLEPACAALWRRGLAAEEAGDPRLALRRLHALRGALLALRGSGGGLRRRWLSRINQRVATLSAAAPGAALGLRSASGRVEILRRLERPPEPNPVLTALGLGGLLLWLGAVIFLLFAALDRHLRVASPRRCRWALGVALGAVLVFFGAMAYAQGRRFNDFRQLSRGVSGAGAAKVREDAGPFHSTQSPRSVADVARPRRLPANSAKRKP